MHLKFTFLTSDNIKKLLLLVATKLQDSTPLFENNARTLASVN